MVSDSMNVCASCVLFRIAVDKAGRYRNRKKLSEKEGWRLKQSPPPLMSETQNGSGTEGFLREAID
jgi:hypothetical protein